MARAYAQIHGPEVPKASDEPSATPMVSCGTRELDSLGLKKEKKGKSHLRK